ncbi:MAG: GTPase HflX [Alphaproteobacteria bacterium CG_4_9_14_3_um_filter_47_13]|nr:MAG: GTPase HflX [Alphaproteobacteria bacterium CG_4_9_14_3_um_filter_47_13]
MIHVPENEKNMQEAGAGTALVIHPELTDFNGTTAEDKLEEAIGLAEAISLTVVEGLCFQVKRPVAGYLISKGHRQDIGHLIHDFKPDVVIVNHSLTPVQQRNLEKDWNAKVIDRTGLILEIFGRRAQTKEGKIQVELAALEYQRSRLVKSWTHLERQRGGLGKTGGPGETQIEIDRRLISERIIRLKKEMQGIRKNRELQRRSREQAPFPLVALVGYTNAGKSTLFNFLTGAAVFAEDLLFATLDTTMRKRKMDNGQDIILSDTVGFIADLPTHLIAAFRATLEQLQYADVILHVRDITREDHMKQKENVIEILKDLGISYDQDGRIIEAWNKIDLLPPEERELMRSKVNFMENVVPLSAITGEGTDDLLSLIEHRLTLSNRFVSFKIPVSEGKAMAWLYQNAHVLETIEDDGFMVLSVDITQENFGRFTERFPYKPMEQKDNNKRQIHDSKY